MVRWILGYLGSVEQLLLNDKDSFAWWCTYICVSSLIVVNMLIISVRWRAAYRTWNGMSVIYDSASLQAYSESVKRCTYIVAWPMLWPIESNSLLNTVRTYLALYHIDSSGAGERAYSIGAYRNQYLYIVLYHTTLKCCPTYEVAKDSPSALRRVWVCSLNFFYEALIV